jgi:hypothetical protein
VMKMLIFLHIRIDDYKHQKDALCMLAHL